MTKPLIAVENLHYTYQPDTEQPIDALRGVSLEVLPGEHLAIVGQNGSGKSTLAKCLNGLLRPSQGQVRVRDWSTTDPEHTFDVRSQVGIVLQTPDNQFVATTVAEEIAFGPENLGVPQPELSRRVDQALQETGLEAVRQRNPRLLAAGQKARLAVASILAMQPDCLILDESTALLDPLARREMLQLIQRLVQRGLAVVTITHFMDEAALADRVVVLRMGHIVRVGPPQDVLNQGEQLASWGLELTSAARLADRLRQRGLALPAGILTTAALASALVSLQMETPPAQVKDQPAQALPSSDPPGPGADHAIQIEQLDHTYLAGTPLAQPALHGVSLTVERGQIVALVGASGAGKSTLAHYVNGLERPSQAGRVRVLARDTADATCSMAALRQDVALVFQYPHHQLLERFVGDDVAYGPRQLRLPRGEVKDRVVWAMQAVGLDFDLYVDRATFGLSGGEMRRVALAGALAMLPKLLVLDEATTGLDPQGRLRVHGLLRRLNQEQGLTVLLVTNDMDEAAALCDQVTVLQAGRVVAQGAPDDVFAQPDLIATCGLLPPQATELSQLLSTNGLQLTPTPVTTQQAEEALWQALQR